MPDSGPKLSRRDLLKLGFGVTAGYVASKLNPFDSEKSSEPTSSPETIIIHDSLPSGVALQATATALNEKNLQTSFEEKGGFTKEVFKQVQGGVFYVEVLLNKNTAQGVKEISTKGTGWLAKIDKNELYLVINNHFLPEGATITEILFGRPSIDKELFSSKKLTGATYRDPDLAVIKVRGDFRPTTPFQPLDWQDNFPFNPKDNVLIVGFPGVFRRSEKPLDFATLGEVGTVVRSGNSQKTEWMTRALITAGNSGSPVFILRGNKPIVGGIVFATTDKINLEIQRNEFQNQQPAIFTSLQLTPLINAIPPL